MSQQADIEAELTRDAFDMWFAEKKYPEPIRGLLWAAWADGWLRGMERGLSRGANAAQDAFHAAVKNVFGPKP